jgi:hypothetical protein
MTSRQHDSADRSARRAYAVGLFAGEPISRVRPPAEPVRASHAWPEACFAGGGCAGARVERAGGGLLRRTGGVRGCLRREGRNVADPMGPRNVWGSAVWEARSRRTRPAVATRGEGAVDRRDEVGTRLADGRWRKGRSGETPLAPVARSPCPGDLHGPSHEATSNHYGRQRLGYTIGRNVRPSVGRMGDAPLVAATAFQAAANRPRSRRAKRGRDQRGRRRRSLGHE